MQKNRKLLIGAICAFAALLCAGAVYCFSPIDSATAGETTPLSEFTVEDVEGGVRLTYKGAANVDVTIPADADGKDIIEVIIPNDSGLDITGLDVSRCTKIKYLNCGGNKITKLETQYNTELVELNVEGNPIGGLDLTHNTKLVTLKASSTSIGDLSCIAHCPDLQYLIANKLSHLREIDLSSNTKLIKIELESNELRELDISALTELQELRAAGNDIGVIYVDKNTKLTYLSCEQNRMPSPHVDTIKAWLDEEGHDGAVEPQKDIPISWATFSPESVGPYTYTGSAFEPEFTLTYADLTLVQGSDYSVLYQYNINVPDSTEIEGYPGVIFTGKGDYSGTYDLHFDILPASITKAEIASIGDQTYTGAEIKPSPTITYNGKKLVKGTDYTLSYSNNIDKGTATITIKGQGNFTGDTKTTFKIIGDGELKDINQANMVPSQIPEQKYTGDYIKPSFVLNYDLEQLEEGVDYTYVYQDNIQVGTAKIVITGIGEYTGTKTAEFEIVTEYSAKKIVSAEVDENSDLTYSGNPIKPAWIVQGNDGKTLTAGTDFTVTYDGDNTNAGEVAVTVTGKGQYSGSINTAFTIKPYNFANLENIVSMPDVVYTGQPLTPEPDIVFNGTTLVKDSDYALSYSNNVGSSTAVTEATITILSIDKNPNFIGSKSATFRIIPTSSGGGTGTDGSNGSGSSTSTTGLSKTNDATLGYLLAGASAIAFGAAGALYFTSRKRNRK